MQSNHDEAPANPSPIVESCAASDVEENYALLLRLARGRLRGGRPGETLQATALANEAWMRLAMGNANGTGEGSYVALASTAIRSVLVDAARARTRLKRGGGAERVPLDDVLELHERRAGDLDSLDGALMRFALLDPRAAQLVELRFFGGLTMLEAANSLNVSLATAERDWTLARAWLQSALERD